MSEHVIVVNLDDDIVFGTLLSPSELRLLMFVSDKNVRDVNWLKHEKIMIGKAKEHSITSAKRSRVWETFRSGFFFSFLIPRLRIS